MLTSEKPLCFFVQLGGYQTHTDRERRHLVIHSDCGCHYRWPEWIGICEEAGIARSMSRKGCSPDNSRMEVSSAP